MGTAVTSGAVQAPLLAWRTMPRRERAVTVAFLAPLALCPFGVVLAGSLAAEGSFVSAAPRLAWLSVGVPLLAVVGPSVVVLASTLERWPQGRLRAYRGPLVAALALWACLLLAWPAAFGWTLFFVMLALAVGFIASRESFWDLWVGDLVRPHRDVYSLTSDLMLKLLFGLTLWWVGVLGLPVLVAWRQMVVSGG